MVKYDTNCFLLYTSRLKTSCRNPYGKTQYMVDAAPGKVTAHLSCSRLASSRSTGTFHSLFHAAEASFLFFLVVCFGRIVRSMHVLLAKSRTCCNDDVSRLVIEHACCLLFHAFAAHRPSRPVPVNRVAGRRLFGISRTRCTCALSVTLFHVLEKQSKRDN